MHWSISSAQVACKSCRTTLVAVGEFCDPCFEEMYEQWANESEIPISDEARDAMDLFERFLAYVSQTGSHKHEAYNGLVGAVNAFLSHNFDVHTAFSPVKHRETSKSGILRG
jgi:hypothetical protein